MHCISVRRVPGGVAGVGVQKRVCGGQAQSLPNVHLVLAQRSRSFLLQRNQHAGLGQREALIRLADLLVEPLPGPVYQL